jgi:hypothetical protein
METSKQRGGTRPGAGRPAHEAKRKIRSIRAYDDEWELITIASLLVKNLPNDLAQKYILTFIDEVTNRHLSLLKASCKKHSEALPNMVREEKREALDELILLTNQMIGLRNIPIDVAAMRISEGQSSGETVPLKAEIEISIEAAMKLQSEIMKQLSWPRKH